ncbi:hypothetical protein JHK87_003414 [Glycine soja]|nr:hypothetical protein JHK87_003414 [Glycine soja]KAG5079494.1 hypothetical protein JHK86_003559 [Glycine max]
MENGDSFFRHGQPTKSTLGSIIPFQQTDTYANTTIQPPINSNNGGPIPSLVLRDKSKMPITNVTKITGQILPNNAKISYDAMDMIQQGATKYINFVTRKAKEQCQSEYRKIMNAEDLLWAMKKLGFNDYVEPLTAFVQRYRNIEGSDLFTSHKEPIPHIENNEPRPNPMPTLEILHSPVPPPVHSSKPYFSIDTSHRELIPHTENNGPSLGLEPNHMPTLEMTPLSPSVHPFESYFSIDPDTNLEILDPNDINEIYLDEFGVGCSNDAFNNVDVSALFKHDQP